MRVIPALVLVVHMALSTLAMAQSAATSHCLAGEAVAFSCSLGDRMVSLCTSAEAGVVKSLSFREGAPGRVSQEFVAGAQTGQRFHASVSPVGPRALVREVWFEQKGRAYVLTECVGGECSHSAGLAVFRGDRLLSNKRCRRTPDDKAWFSRALVEFASEPTASKSHTDLLQIEEVGNAVEKLYRSRRH